MVAAEKTAVAARCRGLALDVRDARVTYEVYEEPHRSFKAIVARGFRPASPRRVEAVRGVSFELHEGEALGLVGLNGSGKSSLLRAVAGLVPLADGRIRARSEPVLLGVGAALHPQLSARRNVYLGGTALGLSRREVEERFEEIVDWAGVGDFIDMPLRAFSTGMAARLRFAIAAAVEPDILLIDEAIGVGDAAFKRRSEERMRQLTSRAGALVLVSHSTSSIRSICTRVVWLHQGEVHLDGATDEVLAAYDAFTSGSDSQD
jgi:teichoic acid transport system ATP-binding protein